MNRKRVSRRMSLRVENLEGRQLLSLLALTQPDATVTIPSNDPFTVTQPVDATDINEDTIAPPTVQPVALPPAGDCTTPVSTTTTPLPTVPDGTANNPFDVSTAQTVATSPTVTSLPVPTSNPTVLSPPAPSTPTVNPLNPDPSDETLPDDWNGSPTTTDPTPIIPIMPPVPGASTTTTDPSLVTYQQSQNLLNNMVGGTAPGSGVLGAVATVAGTIATTSLTGCGGTVPQVVDPNGVPIPAPPSSTTNPPAGQVLPSSSTPVPLTLTAPSTSTLAVTSPSYDDWMM